MTAKQQELWSILLKTLACDVQEGVRPDIIIGSDEFGQLFFPQNDSMFAVVGSKHVTCSVWMTTLQVNSSSVCCK